MSQLSINAREEKSHKSSAHSLNCPISPVIANGIYLNRGGALIPLSADQGKSRANELVQGAENMLNSGFDKAIAINIRLFKFTYGNCATKRPSQV